MHGIALHLGSLDERGRRLVVAQVDGQEVRDLMETDLQWRRQQYAKNVASKVEFPYNGNGHERSIAQVEAWLDAEIVRLADLEDERQQEGRDWAPEFRFMSDVKTEKLEWLQPGVIPLGKPTGVNGNPGDGKSVLLCDYAARVSTGAPWPNDPRTPQDPGGVVILSAEDDPEDTIKPRLEAAGADCTKIIIVDAMKMVLPDGEEIKRCVDLSKDIPRVEAALEALKSRITPKLLTIDPITAYMGDGTDSHKNAEVRTFLAQLATLAAKWNIAIVMVNHLNKGQGSALYRTQGSIAFVAAVRAAWLLCRDRQNPSSARRLFLPLKSNLAKDSEGFAFVLSSEHSSNGQPLCEWEAEPVKTTADDALRFEPQKKGPKAEELAEAVEFLRGALAGGPRPTAEVQAEAKGRGISASTLKRARNEIGTIASRPKVPGPWFLELRQGVQVSEPLAPLAPLPEPLEPLEPLASLPGQNTQESNNVCIEDQEDQVEDACGDDDEYGHLPAQEF